LIYANYCVVVVDFCAEVAGRTDKDFLM